LFLDACSPMMCLAALCLAVAVGFVHVQDVHRGRGAATAEFWAGADTLALQRRDEHAIKRKPLYGDLPRARMPCGWDGECDNTNTGTNTYAICPGGWPGVVQCKGGLVTQLCPPPPSSAERAPPRGTPALPAVPSHPTHTLHTRAQPSPRHPGRPSGAAAGVRARPDCARRRRAGTWAIRARRGTSRS
jgi:hypothetical protein